MNTETRNKELTARRILQYEPTNIIGERDVEKRYRLLVEYEDKYKKYSICPHCGAALDKIDVLIEATEEYNVTNAGVYIDNQNVESIEYICPYCGGDIDREAVKFLFGTLYWGD